MEAWMQVGLSHELPAPQQVTEAEPPHLPHAVMLFTCLGQSSLFPLSWPAAQSPKCTAEWHNRSLAETPSSLVSHQGLGSQTGCPPILAEEKHG